MLRSVSKILVSLAALSCTPVILAQNSAQESSSGDRAPKLSAPASGTPSPAAVSSDASNTSLVEPRRLLQLGKYDEALAQLKDLEVKSPDLPGLPHELGHAYYRKGDYINAIAYFQKAQAADATDNEAVQLLGLSYYLAGKPGDAIPRLEKVQTWFPSANVDASYILGICYIQIKDYPQARKSFAKMFSVGPDSAASYLFTARMLLRQDFGPIAAEYAEKAIAIDSKLPLGHQLLGELYLYQSKIPEATAQFEAELALNPGYPPAYYKLADAYSRVQKYDEAEKLLQRSIWLDATSTGPYILLGKVLEKKGETELAVRALQRALAMDPNNPIPHHLLGQSYRTLGRMEDAERELKLAESLQSAKGQQR
jgi:tetratricopeptide (TPR) repeat protein